MAVIPAYPTGPPISGSDRRASSVARHLRDRPFDQRDDEGVDDLLDRLAALHRPAEVGAGLLVDGGPRSVTVPGGVDGGHRETVLRRVVPGPGHQPRIPLVQAAVVAAQDQRGRGGS
jgi:hypothetical protein